jgi:hypothetical protein
VCVTLGLVLFPRGSLSVPMVVGLERSWRRHGDEVKSKIETWYMCAVCDSSLPWSICIDAWVFIGVCAEQLNVRTVLSAMPLGLDILDLSCFDAVASDLRLVFGDCCIHVRLPLIICPWRGCALCTSSPELELSLPAIACTHQS